MTESRIGALEPPYAEEVASVFNAIMPRGVAPLQLFRALAQVPRIFTRFRAASLLDPGPISLRQREIVIHRTCARCACEYEWGVHAAFFAKRAALTEEQLVATVHGDGDAPQWSAHEKLLIQTVDELHDNSRLSPELWDSLALVYSIEQILEVIALIGFYHTVSYFANGLDLSSEPFGVPMPRA